MARRIAILLFAAILTGSLHAQDPVRDSVVKVHVTARTPDFMRPWTKASPKKSTGSGAIIDGNRILTNAHVVLYAKQIFVQFNQSTDRHPAKTVAISPTMDLAILEVDDASLLEGRPPLKMRPGIPSFKNTVNVYGYPLGGDDLAVTDGIISRIEYASYFNSGAGLRIQVDAAINPGNSGGPAVIDGELVGLVFSKISKADNIGYLIPTDEIQMFLDDVEDGKYDGKPNLFDSLQSTENTALRAKLKLKSDRTGIMVKRPYAEDSPLEPWDVITHIGGDAVDNKGHVVVRDDLRLFFKHFIPQEAKDGMVNLKVWRAGEEVEVAVPVHKVRSTVLPELNGNYPRHFIYGPIVFTVATKDLLRSLGGGGLAFLSAMDSPLVSRNGAKPDFPGEELVIYRLLPHLTTKGYNNVPFGVISKVNDVEIKNLRHFVQTIRDCEDEFITYTVPGKYETMVFKRSDMEDTTEEILSDEGIRYQYSKDLEALWEGDEDAEVAAPAQADSEEDSEKGPEEDSEKDSKPAEESQTPDDAPTSEEAQDSEQTPEKEPVEN